ncbi:MAG: carbon dioxide-concentrating mechanism protein CcmK [Leptolyngbyaceae cyanobacterium MO_188.B28]|nr:carbon dioxide-concentrating mechanism protein CcmK [Leptolyngbyaceae cyanobacterium MO_188.B28]
MPIAIGVIETQGFPTALAAADAMVKGGRVTLVTYNVADSGRQYVTVRGPVSEVNRAVAAGIEAANKCPGVGEVTTHYIVPNPPENIETVLPLNFTEASESFRV